MEGRPAGLPLLAAQGHGSSAIATDHAAEVAEAGAEPHVTDIEMLDDGGWRGLLADADLIVWSAGAGGGNPERTKAVDEVAAKESMDAAPKDAGYVMVSYWGARRDHGVPETSRSSITRTRRRGRRSPADGPEVRDPRRAH